MRNTGKLYVVGVGMGFETLTEEAKKIIVGADLICGAPRMVAIARDHGLCKKEAVIYEEYRAERVFEKIAENMQSEAKTDSREEVSVLLVSGDTGFYSAAHAVRTEMLKRKNDGREIVSDVIPIPGISSVSYFFAKCGLPWQDAKLISCHGRKGAPVSAVRRNRLTFALTGNNTGELAETLCEYGFGELAVHIGQDLGSEKERIIHTTVAEMRTAETSNLTVLIVENPQPDCRQRSGISDDDFVRGDVPMTKKEVRAQIMSALEISPGDVCVDVGCGTGSVTVEMALAAYEGMVCGCDVSEEAVALTRENLKKFGIANASIVAGRAPEILSGWFSGEAEGKIEGKIEGKAMCKAVSEPGAGGLSGRVPHVAFIGGTKGGMHAILEYLIGLNPEIRLCITAIALETATEALKALDALGREAEVVQIQTARGRKVAGLHMMTAQNPIMLIRSVGVRD